MLLTGLNLRFDKTVDLSAVVNVTRLKDGRLQFTAVPLLYGSYTTSSGAGTFSLEPPTRLNVAAGLPVVGHALGGGSHGKTRRPPEPRRSRARRKALRPLRVRKCSSSGSSVPSPSPKPRFRPPPSPTPLPEDAPVAPGYRPSRRRNRRPPWRRPLAPVTKPTATPLQPFISPTPASIATTAGGKWPTYPPGQMPRGRLANVPDMSELASRGVGGERVYLQGSFVVTASGQDRAVLRSQAALPENLGIGGRSSNTRIIVQFPSGSRPPSEGSTLSRDSRRPFLVTEVRKTSDGQVNVYVREVTRAQ